MVKTTVVGLGAVAATSEASCLVAAVAFWATFPDAAMAFPVVLTCQAVVEQSVPLMVVASLQFPYLFPDLVRDPYNFPHVQTLQLSFHKMAATSFPSFFV
jgi:hypothetical protein